MTIRAKLLCAVAVSGFAAFATMPAQALSMSECSAKYKEAKTAGTLNGQKWNDFRKAECGADAAAAPAAAPAAPPPVAAAGQAGSPRRSPQRRRPRSAMRYSRPPWIPKYAQESAGKARMHTCVDQYNANKASNENGGLKWIQKGGGYYSECNKKLKGLDRRLTRRARRRGFARVSRFSFRRIPISRGFASGGPA